MAVANQKLRVAAPALIRPRRKRPASAPPQNRLIARARRKFLRAFPGGFRDETYLDWERDYKWQAHLRWQENLNKATFRRLIDSRQLEVVAKLASSIESRTNLLFSFEKMALRDAVRSEAGARAFFSAGGRVHYEITTAGRAAPSTE